MDSSDDKLLLLLELELELAECLVTTCVDDRHREWVVTYKARQEEKTKSRTGLTP